jgi:hypothetical protein
MKKSSLLRVLSILVTSVVLICTPELSFASGGHGGGGFHGGGGGGFHGGGFGGYRGGWGGAGWHGGWGGYGWRGGWGYPGWGWGVGFGFGWGWGSYWGYPYAYGYPYYYPYYPYYPYYGPNAYPPGDPDRHGGSRDPRDNSEQQNSSYPGPQRSSGVYDKIPATTLTSHRPVGDSSSVKYWLANYQQGTVPRQQVRNVVQALLAMPPEARRRQVESGRYRNFSPEEQDFLNQVAQVSPREPQKNMDEMKPAALRVTSE